MHLQGSLVPPGVWNSAAFAALPTKIPSLSLGHEFLAGNRR